MAHPTYDAAFEAMVQQWAEAHIPEKRHVHVRGVVKAADALARQFAPDQVMRARLAGWLHDAAKHWSSDDLLAYAEDHGLPVTPGDRMNPKLLHGAVGYALAAAEFGLNDGLLRRACTNHTTGAAGMSAVEKAVFVADLIEPNRDFPGVEALRADAARDLDAATLRAVVYTLRHLLDGQRFIDPRALDAYNELISAGVRLDSAPTPDES